ncbi:MAG: SDR family oxidoreductase, partial [Alphaproteobacteria bacterium]
MAEWIKRFSLAGKAALVTGATKGIGLEICKVLADAGADIAAVGRDQAGLAEVQKAVEAQGRKCVTIAGDLATTEGPVRAAQQALKSFGTIDILVNNAGIALIDTLLEASIEDWDQTMAVNLRAPFLLARELAPKMIAQRSGKIINISSQAGIVAID